jgi:hypothetical protein
MQDGGSGDRERFPGRLEEAVKPEPRHEVPWGVLAGSGMEWNR